MFKCMSLLSEVPPIGVTAFLASVNLRTQKDLGSLIGETLIFTFDYQACSTREFQEWTFTKEGFRAKKTLDDYSV
jgi:hypothetical protein